MDAGASGNVGSRLAQTGDLTNCSLWDTDIFTLVESELFGEWFARLRDSRAKHRISQRLARAASGNLGDVKPVGAGISELRIDYGPGYRIYCARRGGLLLLLLCGGDKSSQAKDISKAQQALADWDKEFGDEVEGFRPL